MCRTDSINNGEGGGPWILNTAAKKIQKKRVRQEPQKLENAYSPGKRCKATGLATAGLYPAPALCSHPKILVSEQHHNATREDKRHGHLRRRTIVS